MRHSGDVGTASTKRLLVTVVSLIAVAVAVGAIALWPSTLHASSVRDASGATARYEAKVVSVTHAECVDAAGASCTSATVELLAGPDDGSRVRLPETADDASARLTSGDRIVVAHDPDAGAGLEYAFAERDHRLPLAALAIALVIAVVALARTRGLRALAAVLLALVIVAVFVVPAIVDGREPLAVALVGGAAITLALIYGVRGIDRASSVAVIGAVSGLAAVGALAWVFERATRLSASIGDLGVVHVGSASLHLDGLLLAGIVLGAVGVVADAAGREALAVQDVRAAAAGASRRAVWREAARDSRTRIASTATTLALAYAGASLPALLLLTQAERGVSDALNADAVAGAIALAVIGTFGAVSAIPITTALAAWLLDADAQPGGRNDPRRYRSRVERELWGDVAAERAI
jgi:uncharacterized membrane protein